MTTRRKPSPRIRRTTRSRDARPADPVLASAFCKLFGPRPVRDLTNPASAAAATPRNRLCKSDLHPVTRQGAQALRRGGSRGRGRKRPDAFAKHEMGRRGTSANPAEVTA